MSGKKAIATAEVANWSGSRLLVQKLQVATQGAPDRIRKDLRPHSVFVFLQAKRREEKGKSTTDKVLTTAWRSFVQLCRIAASSD